MWVLYSHPYLAYQQADGPQSADYADYTDFIRSICVICEICGLRWAKRRYVPKLSSKPTSWPDALR
jgi:hypothetical protein